MKISIISSLDPWLFSVACMPHIPRLATGQSGMTELVNSLQSLYTNTLYTIHM